MSSAVKQVGNGDAMLYLDNAAATPLAPEVLSYISEYAPLLCGNQEAIHGAAYRLRQRLREAADEIIHLLCGREAVADTALFWGESGTQLLNAFLSLPLFRRGNIITTALEHPALLAALSRTGAEIRTVRTPRGRIDLEHLTELIDANTVLVALHQVHNEIGLIQELPAIRERVRRRNSAAWLLVDSVQAAGKLPIPWQEAEIDCCLISGHKFGAMGGGALLYRNHHLPGEGRVGDYLQRLRSQHYLLSRPEPLQALCLARALRLCYSRMAERYEEMSALSHWLRDSLKRLHLPDGSSPIITAPPEVCSPYIVHLLLPGLQSAVIVRMLSESNIMLSAGSACAAEKPTPGKTMAAIGYPQHSYAALRVSLWHNTTMAMLQRFVEELRRAIDNY